MTEEQKAIERLTKAQNDIWYATLYSQEEQDKDIQTVLNLIQKQEEEIEKKDKIIDLIAKKINQAYFEEMEFEEWFETKVMKVQEKADYGYVVPLIKEYFGKTVEDI